MNIGNIEDYLTTEEFPIGFELTSYSDNGDGDIHTHSFFEIFYMVNGRAKHVSMNTQTGSSTTATLLEGDISLITMDTAHYFMRENNSDYTHRDIVIRKDVFKKVCDFLSPDLYEKLLNGEIPPKTSVSMDKIIQFEHKIKLINQILPSKKMQKIALVKSLVVSLLECFLASDTEEYFSNFPLWFNNLLSNFNKIEYMQAGLGKIISSCNYDKKYLCYVFKKFTGITMTEHLNNVRLSHALGLLQSTNKTISSIAQYLGFSSVSYFNVIFKEKYGVTPKEIRKNKRCYFY